MKYTSSTQAHRNKESERTQWEKGEEEEEEEGGVIERRGRKWEADERNRKEGGRFIVKPNKKTQFVSVILTKNKGWTHFECVFS